MIYQSKSVENVISFFLKRLIHNLPFKAIRKESLFGNPFSPTKIFCCGCGFCQWFFFTSSRIDIIKYVIYGIASAFFVYGILLMVEGFFTSGAIKDLYGDFKITTCGRCVSAWVGPKLNFNL